MLSRSSPNIAVEKLRLKKDVDSLLTEFNLDAGRTVKESKSRLLAHQKTQQRLYEENNWNTTEINFAEDNSLKFEDISIVDEHLIYAACSSKRSLEQISLKRDSVGIQGTTVTIRNHGRKCTACCCTNQAFLFFMAKAFSCSILTHKFRQLSYQSP